MVGSSLSVRRRQMVGTMVGVTLKVGVMAG